MNKLVKRLLTGTLAFATILTALPVTAVHASGNQYWTESAERVGYIELTEISDTLQIGLPLVKYRLQKARKQLRELLGKEELDE